VNRALLPAVVRAGTALTPPAVRAGLAARVSGSPALTRAFEELHWEPDAAWSYLLATLLMWGSFAGFGYFAARLTVRTCDLPATPWIRTGIAAAALLLLMPFFTYNSFPYDPPQLLLFTMAIEALASQSRTRFAVAFVLCCVNKETAVLLVPIAALTSPGDRRPARIAWMLAVYAVVRGTIGFMFRHAPGGAFEFHLGHNLRWLTHGWNLGDAVNLLVLVFLVGYGWSHKPAFLRTAFVWAFLPLVLVAMFLGFVDESRGYYEAYAAGFALAVDTARRIARSGATSSAG
jgi:hypothetical protein